MFYKLIWDMERIDQSIKDGTNTIYAQKTNLESIEYEGIIKGFFNNIILNMKGNEIKNWPRVEFYYSSKASNLENEYLLNVVRWPIIHKKVMEEFICSNIEGIQYLPIYLIDVVTDKVNEDYVVMNIQNFIEAYDMEKSNYTYNEKYNVYSFLPHEIILDKNVCQNYDIFRCEKDFVNIYISDKIKGIIEKNKWVGFDFHPQKTN